MEPSDPQEFYNRLHHLATQPGGVTLNAGLPLPMLAHGPSVQSGSVTLSGNLPITQTGDLRPSRIAEIMRLEMENASLRAAYADLEARYAALFSLHVKQPAVIPDAAPEFPARALTHQRQPIGLLTGRGE